MSFSLAGIRIEIHFAFFAVLLLLTQLTGNDWAIWCAFCCLIHELGHVLAYSICGTRPREIHLEAGGMRIIPPQTMLSNRQEAFVLLGGVLANFLAAGILISLQVWQAAGVHLFLAAFNLIPLRALDGGQLLALAFRKIFLPNTAEKMTAGIHWIFLGILLTAGIFLLFRTGNFTLLLTVICLGFL
ncbi:MAG: site-2 protease family protein [Candidatus Merdivicinus sp.]|jgi:stage IV sporulation protein FB